jgi:NAD(P)-dependent dehydrogenase (short-subunit alcohol dehydrogenase family)
VDIEGKNALVLGGNGLVGMAVCRRLLARRPAGLVVASLRRDEAEAGAGELRRAFPEAAERIRPAWGDILLRAEWQDGQPGVHPRTSVLADPVKRRRLVADILDELNEDILQSSLLYQLILGTAPGMDRTPAQIVVDCVNTATAVAYQNIFQTARRLEERIARNETTNWPEEVERLLASQYVPQLVRHMQILYEAMLRAGTLAYVKVGTSGTGGMGFNIPYTHGEERPSRVLLSKSAVAGAQSLLTFLIARTPGGPPVVKEIKPTAVIAWKDIGFGPIRRGGRELTLVDCPPEQALSLDDPRARVPEGEFGVSTGTFALGTIDTGENGLFAAGEFSAITTLGQMEFVTPEEIADNVIAEIGGAATGREVVQALDGAVMGPSYRAGILRQAAVNRLRQLQAENEDESVAFEILGPPRLSKLLYEAHLLKRVCGTLGQVLQRTPAELAGELELMITDHAALRRRILSIGIPILLSDGRRLLRGPTLKAQDAEHGWVDLTPHNMAHWQDRISGLRAFLHVMAESGSGSTQDRVYPSAALWAEDDAFDVGEVVGWLFIYEEKGRRGKA